MEIFNELAPGFDLAPITDVQAIRDTMPLQFLRAHRIPLWKLPALRLALIARQKEEMSSIRLYPGMPEVLSGLGREGCRMGIVSSNSEENIRSCLRANAAEACFEFVVGYPRLFGKQRVLRRIVRKSGLASRDVLYVGDEVRDIAAARSAGIDVAAVTWGINTPSLLARHSPSRLIDRPEQLLDLVVPRHALE